MTIFIMDKENDITIKKPATCLHDDLLLSFFQSFVQERTKQLQGCLNLLEIVFHLEAFPV